MLEKYIKRNTGTMFSISYGINPFYNSEISAGSENTTIVYQSVT